MIPFRAKPNAKRDELAQAQKISGLPLFKRKGLPGGKTWQETAEQVKGLETEGAGPMDVYNETAKDAGPGETGAYRNAAGQLMFQIPDNSAILKPEALNWMKSGMTRDWNGELSPPMNLGRLMSHESLYDYDPRIAETQTRISQPEPGDTQALAGGSYTDVESGGPKIRASGRMGTDPARRDEPMSVLNLLGHETQHRVADLYQLPRGGNPKDEFMNAFFNAQMKPQANKLRVELQTAREKHARDYTQHMGQGPSMEMLEAGRADWANQNRADAALLEQAVRVGGEPGQFGGQGRPSVPKKPGFEGSTFNQYESLAGEQAATGPQKTMGMGIEELRANHPMAFGGTDRLHPALQMIKWGNNDFQLPDLDWFRRNSVAR